MEAIKKTLVVITSAVLFASNLSAQTTISNTPYLFPTRDEIRSGTFTEQIVGGTATSETYLTSFGLNNYFTTSHLPQYMFDVYCDPTNGTLTDINISCPNCTPANSVGYRIGDTMIIWHAGRYQNIYVGAFAGNTNNVYNCTFLGNYAGNSNSVSNTTALGIKPYT